MPTFSELKAIAQASVKFRGWRPSHIDLNFTGEVFLGRGGSWHSGPEPKMNVDHAVVALEPHYKPIALARMWGLSADTIREMFENEPGVLKHGHDGTRTKRAYRTFTIPESVAVRVHRKLSAG